MLAPNIAKLSRDAWSSGLSRRPTIADLARAADVSVATVDRVLNARHRVRETTAERVLGAAEAIGYHATPLIKSRLRAESSGAHVRLSASARGRLLFPIRSATSRPRRGR